MEQHKVIIVQKKEKRTNSVYLFDLEKKIDLTMQ